LLSSAIFELLNLIANPRELQRNLKDSSPRKSHRAMWTRQIRRCGEFLSTGAKMGESAGNSSIEIARDLFVGKIDPHCAIGTIHFD
jgi:hypothetical protein